MLELSRNSPISNEKLEQMPKKSSSANLSFEDAMEKVADIVDKMESSQLPLEELLNYYDEGKNLVTECEATLQSAKKRLETIKKGGTKAKTAAAAKPKPTKPSPSDDDEIRLF